MTPSEQFEELIGTMLTRSDATYGADQSKGARRAFGATSLKSGGKIFAMLVNDRLVLKLPAKRIDELIDQGLGERFDPGRGRIQKQWISLRVLSFDDRVALATEAQAFVAQR